MPPPETSDQCKSFGISASSFSCCCNCRVFDWVDTGLNEIAWYLFHCRYQYHHDAEAAQAIIKAQSNMLQPLKQLRRLVWVENCQGRHITLPWPEMPVNLEELELTSGVHLSSADQRRRQIIFDSVCGSLIHVGQLGVYYWGTLQNSLE